MVGVEEYAASISARLQDLPLNDVDGRSIYATVSLSYDRLSDPPRALANICSVLASNDIDFDFVRLGAGVLPSEFEAVARDRIALSAAFAELQNSSLIEIVQSGRDKIYSMHVLTQRVIRKRLQAAGDLERWIEAAIDVVHAFVPHESEKKPELWGMCNRVASQVIALSELNPERTENISAISAMASEIGVYLFERGDVDSALNLSKISLDLAEKVHGKNSLQHARQLNNIGHMYFHLGLTELAREYYEDVANVGKNLGLEKHPEYAVWLSNLGELYARMGQHSSADILLQKAVQIAEFAFGADSPAVADRLLYVAHHAMETRDFERALSVALRALSISRDNFGEMHPDTARSYESVAAARSLLRHADVPRPPQ